MLKSKNLVGCWKFEGNANDSSGNGYHGTLYNATIMDSVSKFGKCCDFDGTDYYVEGDFSCTKDEWTICAWTRPESFASVKGGIGFTDASGVRCELYPYNNQIRTFHENKYSVTTSNVITSVGTWVHIAASHKVGDASPKVYVNGIEKTSSYLGAAGTGTANKFWVGRIGAGAGSYCYVGQIDEAMIFNKVLSQSNIKRLMMGLHPF